MSADDAVLHEVEYYIRFLARNSDLTAAAAADDDDDVTDDRDGGDDCRHFISLQKLLSFSRLQKSCNGDVSMLR